MDCLALLASLRTCSVLSPGFNIVEEYDDTATWEDVAWLKSITRLDVILKGQSAET